MTKPKYYTSIHKLPLATFIDCLIDANYSALITEGEIPADELLQAWMNLYQEYTEALGTADPTFIRFLTLSRDLLKLQSKYTKIETLTGAMQQIGYVSQFAALLRQLINKPLRFNIAKPEAYKKDIKSCVAVLKALNIRIQLKEGELRSLQQNSTPSQKQMTRADFAATLVNLSDHAGYHVNDQISTGEFCTRINLFNKYLQNKKKQ